MVLLLRFEVSFIIIIITRLIMLGDRIDIDKA